MSAGTETLRVEALAPKDVNKVILVGRVARLPDRQPDGVSATTLCVVDGEGNREWHRIHFNEPQGWTVMLGDRLYVEGRLVYSREVVAGREIPLTHVQAREVVILRRTP